MYCYVIIEEFKFNKCNNIMYNVHNKNIVNYAQKSEDLSVLTLPNETV